MIEMFARSIVMSLAWFTGVNAVACAIAILAAVTIGKPDPIGRPRLLVTIRLFPAFASLVFVATMFLPAQWVFEPRDSDETLGLVVYALAAVGALLLARSLVRAISIARADRQFRPGEDAGTIGGADVRQVDDLPGVSLAGVLKPRILVSSQVVEDLSPSELEVALAHELAHRDAFDNLTRSAFMCAPDLLSGSAIAKRLEQGWREAAEFWADAQASRGDAARAVHLASALIKVARLSAAWTGPSAAPSWSTLHDSALLELRVRQLVNGSVPPAEPLPHPLLTMAVCIAGTIVAVPLFAETIHHITESLVAILP